MNKMAIPPAAIARAIAFAIEQPAEVDVNEIVIRPTRKSNYESNLKPCLSSRDLALQSLLHSVVLLQTLDHAVARQTKDADAVAPVIVCAASIALTTASSVASIVALK
jgi:hypothetical protein